MWKSGTTSNKILKRKSLSLLERTLIAIGYKKSIFLKYKDFKKNKNSITNNPVKEIQLCLYKKKVNITLIITTETESNDKFLESNSKILKKKKRAPKKKDEKKEKIRKRLQTHGSCTSTKFAYTSVLSYSSKMFI